MCDPSVNSFAETTPACATLAQREEHRMEEKEKKEVLKKKEKDVPEPRDVTTCEATAQMR